MMSTRSSLLIVFAVVAGAAIMLGGCGGGGDDLADTPDPVDTTSLEGTVYSTQSSGSATTAQAGGQVPVPDCAVAVVTERTRERLAAGRTDGQGRYRFENLPVDVAVVVEAQVPEVGELLSRVRLGPNAMRADVDENSTLEAWCARFARRGDDDDDGLDGEELADEVAEECRRFQEQNGPPAGVGGPGRPDFANAEQVREAARRLIGATAGEALQQAIDTRAEDDAHRAVRIVIAYLRARHDSELPWTQPFVQSLVDALVAGETASFEEIAAALSAILSAEITPDMVETAVQSLREGLAMETDAREPELIEVIAAVTVATGDAEALRIETEEQLQALIEALVA